MEMKRETDTLADIVRDAADLAARALGYTLARAIEAYVPPHAANRFATRVAVVLLREVRDEGELVMPFVPPRAC